jgi:hypothetical protein
VVARACFLLAREEEGEGAGAASAREEEGSEICGSAGRALASGGRWPSLASEEPVIASRIASCEDTEAVGRHFLCFF